MAKVSRLSVIAVALAVLFVVSLGLGRVAAARTDPPVSTPTAEGKVGQVPPDFTLTTLDGKQQYRLSNLKGKPVAVLFWVS